MKQKNNSVSSAETKDDSSIKADVTTSSPNNAKPNVVRSCFIINESYLDFPICRVDKVFECKDSAIKYASEMNDLAERLHQKN